jgi:ketosteroid isomerase-like protein
MKTREKAAAAYVRGDASPLDAIVEREGLATFFPPSGGSVCGAGEVATRYDADARSFSPDGQSRLEVFDCGASGDLAFWTGFQDADVRLGDRRVKMRLRITELFRRKGGDWKLIHRHADFAASDKRRHAA